MNDYMKKILIDERIYVKVEEASPFEFVKSDINEEPSQLETLTFRAYQLAQ